MNGLPESFGKVSELWLDSKHPLREETVQALQVSTGLSRKQVELALFNAFSELSTEKIQAYIKTDLSGIQMSACWNILHILPANAFTAWLPGVVIASLLGHRSWLKPSRREPVFARAWKKSLESVSSDLASTIGIVSMDEEYRRNSQAVLAYGSDESLRKIRAELPSGKRFVGYGHKLSVGVIFKESADEQSLHDLLAVVQADVEPFRLQGCLSPQILYVENPRMTRWPELEARVDVPPKIKPFERWTDVAAQLEKFNPYLSCVGYAGTSERQAYLERELRDQEGLRLCPLGQMQRPPLAWRNGGVNLADLLH